MRLTGLKLSFETLGIKGLFRLKAEEVPLTFEEVLNGALVIGRPSLQEAIQNILAKTMNSFIVESVAAAGFCHSFSHRYHYRSPAYRSPADRFRGEPEPSQGIPLLSQIIDTTGFLPDISLATIYDLGKQAAVLNWTPDTGRRLLEKMGRYLSQLREFIKDAIPGATMRGFEDALKYGYQLEPKHFFAKENLLAREFLPENLYPLPVLDKLTKPFSGGKYLSLYDRLKTFLIRHRAVVYRCTVQGRQIRCVPAITSHSKEAFHEARWIAQRYGGEHKRYSFTLSFQETEKMIDEVPAEFIVPHSAFGAEFRQSNEEQKTSIYYGKRDIFRCPATKLTERHTRNVDLQVLLKRFGKAAPSVKTDLLERVADLLAELYPAKAAFYKRSIGNTKYLKMAEISAPYFPCLVSDGEGRIVEPLVLPLFHMFVLKHLRGNAILDTSCVNDTFSTRDLAMAVITEAVTAQGCYLPVIERV